jgi:hypothetical protein
MTSRRDYQFLMPANVVIELIDVADEIVRRFSVEENGMIAGISQAQRAQFKLDAPKRTGHITTGWLKVDL